MQNSFRPLKKRKKRKISFTALKIVPSQKRSRSWILCFFLIAAFCFEGKDLLFFFQRWKSWAFYLFHMTNSFGLFLARVRHFNGAVFCERIYIIFSNFFLGGTVSNFQLSEKDVFIFFSFRGVSSFRGFVLKNRFTCWERIFEFFYLEIFFSILFGGLDEALFI